MSRNETKVYIVTPSTRDVLTTCNQSGTINMEQHRTIEIYLAIEESRQGIQDYLVNKLKSTSLFQHNKARQPLPNQKALYYQR